MQKIREVKFAANSIVTYAILLLTWFDTGLPLSLSLSLIVSVTCVLLSLCHLYHTMAQPLQIRSRCEVLPACHRSSLNAWHQLNHRCRREETIFRFELGSVPNRMGGSGSEPGGGAAESEQELPLQHLRALRGSRKAVYDIQIQLLTLWFLVF